MKLIRLETYISALCCNLRLNPVSRTCNNAQTYYPMTTHAPASSSYDGLVQVFETHLL